MYMIFHVGTFQKGHWNSMFILINIIHYIHNIEKLMFIKISLISLLDT